MKPIAVPSAISSLPPRIELGVDRAALDPRGGFAHAGEFFEAVKRAGLPGRPGIDPRLRFEAATPTTVGNEASGTDGGFAVPTQFTSEVMVLARTAEEAMLLDYCDVTKLSMGNSCEMPRDISTPWGLSGVRLAWSAEAGMLSQITPQVGGGVMRMHKCVAFVPLSEDLVEDNAALDSYLTPRFAAAIRWACNEAILNGSGAGQPLGMFSSGAAIVQSKDSGQATGTLSITNITNMLRRLPQGSFGRAQWWMNSDAFASLLALPAAMLPMGPPPAVATATRGRPGTCRSPAAPRNCSTASWIWP
jgi:HK97 family phage major capsid protein